MEKNSMENFKVGGKDHNKNPTVADVLKYDDEYTQAEIDKLTTSFGGSEGLPYLDSYLDTFSSPYADVQYENIVNTNFYGELDFKGWFGSKNADGKEFYGYCSNQAKFNALENILNNPEDTRQMIQTLEQKAANKRNNALYAGNGETHLTQKQKDKINQDYEDEMKALEELGNNHVREFEEMKVDKADSESEYLVKGAILECSCGSHIRRLDMPRTHGWTLKEKAIAHKADCVGEEDQYYYLLPEEKSGWAVARQVAIRFLIPGIGPIIADYEKHKEEEAFEKQVSEIEGKLDPEVNIRCFGHCTSPKLIEHAKDTGKEKKRLVMGDAFKEDSINKKAAQTELGYICEPSFENNEAWELYLKTLRVKGGISPAKEAISDDYKGENIEIISTNSLLKCKYGGYIAPQTSGQFAEVDNPNVSNIFLVNDKQKYLTDQRNLSPSSDPIADPEAFEKEIEMHREWVDLYYAKLSENSHNMSMAHGGYSEGVKTEASDALKDFENKNGLEAPFYDNKKFMKPHTKGFFTTDADAKNNILEDIDAKAQAGRDLANAYGIN